MNRSTRLSAVQRTTMRAVALGAAAGLSVGGATAASASTRETSEEAPDTTQSICIVGHDNLPDETENA